MKFMKKPLIVKKA